MHAARGRPPFHLYGDLFVFHGDSVCTRAGGVVTALSNTSVTVWSQVPMTSSSVAFCTFKLLNLTHVVRQLLQVLL